ncbi:MAG: glutathione S-transferase family protein [Gammaproteobacteria bacterium]|nr:glutathione S-transferase family protein [Gammaproteobacteria bacterium]
MDPYVLLGEECSYRCAKVRAALRFKQIYYVEKSATRNAKDIFQRLDGLDSFPVVITPDDDTWQDTSDILDALEDAQPTPGIYPPTPVQWIASLLWELYAEEFFCLPAAHYRWTYKECNALARRTLTAISGSESSGEQTGNEMDGMRTHWGITDATGPKIEEHFAALMSALNRHFRHHPFLLGDRISLADCALFGPMYAHLYFDPVPKRILLNDSIDVCTWLEATNRPDPSAMGDWLSDDQLAATMLDTLDAIGQDAVPMILDRFHAFETWACVEGELGVEPPRWVGRYQSKLRGVDLEASTSSSTAYSVQRVKDAFDTLDAASQQKVLTVFGNTPWREVLTFEPLIRMEKHNFRLRISEMNCPA